MCPPDGHGVTINQLKLERMLRAAYCDCGNRAAQARQTIDEIDAAIERIGKGTYGICEYSGDPIPKERLRAIPWARERVEYKTRSFR